MNSFLTKVTLLSVFLSSILCHNDISAKQYELVDFGPGYALGINNLGSVVGALRPTQDTSQAFLWQPNIGKQILPSLDQPWSWAEAINDKGQIVGVAKVDGEHHGFLLTPKKVSEPATMLLWIRTSWNWDVWQAF